MDDNNKREKENIRENMSEGEKRAKKWNTILTIAKFAILIVILIGIPAYIIIFKQDVITQFKSLDQATNYLRGYKKIGAIAYIGAQILQIIISVLPGQVFQVAAGFMFGFVPGLLLSLTGAILGSTITYYLARFLGADAMKLFLGEEKMQYFLERLNSEKAYVIIFLIYLIPGLPKDLVCYAAGISDMNLKPFLILSTVGRIPGMCGSLLFGVMYLNKSYTGMIVVGAICAVGLILCLIFRKRLTGVLDNIYKKISE